MNNRKLFLTLTSLLCLGSAAVATAAIDPGAVYQVQPYALSDGFAVAGGFIETDGTIGALTIDNIMDFEIEVSGRMPYVFRPDSPGARFGIAGQIVATPTTIEVSVDPNTSGAVSTFFVAARDNFDDLCSSCAQGVGYVCEVEENPGLPHSVHANVYYGYHDTDGDDVTPSGHGDFSANFGPLVIATIPEPPTLLLLVVAYLGALTRVRPS